MKYIVVSSSRIICEEWLILLSCLIIPHQKQNWNDRTIPLLFIISDIALEKEFPIQKDSLSSHSTFFFSFSLHVLKGNISGDKIKYNKFLQIEMRSIKILSEL